MSRCNGSWYTIWTGASKSTSLASTSLARHFDLDCVINSGSTEVGRILR